MDQHEYNELCIQVEGKLTEFSVDFTELMLLMEAISMLAGHPDFIQYGMELREKLGGMRESILEAHQELGLTTSQIHDLDTMYASEAYEYSHDEAAPETRDRSHLSVVYVKEEGE